MPLTPLAFSSWCLLQVVPALVPLRPESSVLVGTSAWCCTHANNSLPSTAHLVACDNTANKPCAGHTVETILCAHPLVLGTLVLWAITADEPSYITHRLTIHPANVTACSLCKSFQLLVWHGM